MLNQLDILKDCQVEVWSERYAVAKAHYVPDTFLAVFHDQQETTVVANEAFLTEDWVIDAERGWKLLSFRTVLPFELTGFLAVVASALAEEKIPIFVLSAYSTDHLLVKETALEQTVRKLTKLGCTINEL